MRIAEMHYNGWFTLNCKQCGTRAHTYEKPSNKNECTCGNTDLEVVDIEEWTAGDYIQTTTQELRKEGHEKYVSFIDNLYEELKPAISSSELFNKVIRIISNEVFGLME
jgi:hypothetical protein